MKMQLMRVAALILLPLISSVFTFAQTVQKRTFQHTHIQVEPTDKARFHYLKPDTSYYFTCYDEFGDQEITGFLEIDRHWFGACHHCIQVPDPEKDPDGSKGIMKDALFYFETGLIRYLWEYNPGGIVSAGAWYGRGKNEKWFTGFLLKSKLERKSYFVKTKKQLYQNDELVSNSLIEFNSITWPAIKGNWIYNREFSNDSIMLFTSANETPLKGGEYDTPLKHGYIKFLDETHFQYSYFQHSHMTRKSEWWTDGDRLFLAMGGTHIYKIISFTGSELVLQLVHVRCLNNKEFF